MVQAMLSKLFSVCVCLSAAVRVSHHHPHRRTQVVSVRSFVRPSVCLPLRAVLYFYFLFFFLFSFAVVRVCTDATCSIFIWHQVTLFPSHALVYTSQSRVTDNVIVFVASSTCANCFSVKRRNRKNVSENHAKHEPTKQRNKN